MKNNLIFLVFIVFFTLKTDPSFSQASKDSIQITSADNYYKIPKDDFEKILNNRIEGQVSSKLEFWMKLFGVLFALLGAFGVWQIRQILKNSINEVIESNNRNFLLEIKDVKSKIDEQRIEIKEDIKEIYTTIDKRYEEFRNITTEANKAAARIEVERTKSNKSLSGEVKIKMLEEKLKVAVGFNDNDFTSEVIDLLGTEYFKINSPKLIPLIDQYSNSPIKMFSKTYMNGGLDQYFLYEEHYLDSYKQNCLKYCDKAIELSPVYGEAYFTKLAVYAMDYEKTDDKNKKNEYKTEIKNILDIVFNSSELMNNSLIASINYRMNLGNYGQRVNTIKSLFPDEYSKITEKSDEYDKKNPQKFV